MTRRLARIFPAIPAAKLTPSKKKAWSESRIRATAQMLAVHPGILVGRLQHGGALPYRTALNSLKAKLCWPAKDLE